MTARTFGRIAIISVALFSLSACANTIRGIGADAAGTVQAGQDAGRNVAGAAQ